MGAPHRGSSHHHADDHHDHTDNDGDHITDGVHRAEFVGNVPDLSHIADVDHTGQPRVGAIPRRADPDDAPGSVARTGAGAGVDARGADAVIRMTCLSGYTGVP